MPIYLHSLEVFFLPISVFLSHKFSELPLMVGLTPSVVIFLIFALLRAVSARHSKQGPKFSRALTGRVTSGGGSRLKLHVLRQLESTEGHSGS